MSEQHNPQAEQMADESMARNLAHPAQAIWPQEGGLFDRYALAGELSILDVGCGHRREHPAPGRGLSQAWLVDSDILDSNLELARRDSASFDAAEFASMISAIETPPHYADWHVPVVSGRKPLALQELS